MPSEVSTVGGNQSAEELRRELAEAQQQAATVEILRAISATSADPEGIVEAIVSRAARLCHAYDATIHVLDTGQLRLVAHHGPIPAEPMMALTRGFLVGRAVLERKIIQAQDLPAEAIEYPAGSESARRL